MKEADITLDRITDNDCKDIWEWRNHPEVRKQFFDDKVIPWDEHQIWFYSKTKNPGAKIYIARAEKSKIGVIRFEVDDDFIRVSANLNPDFFGRNLGSKIIQLGTDRFFTEMGTDKSVIAEIKEGNIASQKAFAKAGYRLLKEAEGRLIYIKDRVNCGTGRADLGKKIFPVDVFSIKKYGIEKWQKEFFWPVPDSEFIDLCSDIESCLAAYIRNEPREISDLLLIQRNLFREYCQFLHANKVMQAIKSQGMDISCLETSIWYKGIVTGRFSDKSIMRTEEAMYSAIPFYEKTAKKFVKDIMYNANPCRFLKSGGKIKIVMVCGAVPRIMREYMNRMPHFILVTYQRDWLPKNTSYTLPPALGHSIKRVTAAIAADLKTIAGKYKIILDAGHMEHLRQVTEDELGCMARTLFLVRSKIHKKIDLLISGLGNSFNRTLCLVIRENGGHVTSFAHGGGIGLYDNPAVGPSEFTFSDVFVTYTSKSVELFERIKNNHPPVRNNNVAITSCEADIYFKMWQKYKKRKLPDVIKKVMIIGYPHNQSRNRQMAGGFSPIRLDLELRIVNSLKKAGYDIIYKVHPDRAPEADGIFEGKAEVRKGYVEDCLDEADAFLFGSIRTSAFADILCTNKPIIALRMEGDEPFKPSSEKAMECLKKRCRFVNAEFDAQNRIIFDENELIKALSRKPEPPNNEFIETYMFPGGDE